MTNRILITVKVDAFQVRDGLDSFLFNLVVLSSLKTSSGKLWRMNDNDTCIIEITNHSEEQFSNVSVCSFSLLF